MNKTNKILIAAIFVFFLFSAYVYDEYRDWKAEQPVAHHFKSESYESPTHTPRGLFFLDGYIWISSSYDHKLIKYDLEEEKVAKSFEIPGFEPTGLTYDGENFWYADYGKRTIYEVSTEGEVLSSYKTPYSTPYGVTWDGENLWILDVFGLEEYPGDVKGSEGGIYPNAIIYKYIPEEDKILEVIESPTPFSGDIAYKYGELIITGCISQKVFHVDISTEITTQWYISPDNIPRTVADGGDSIVYLSGMETRKIWKVDLGKKALYRDVVGQQDTIVPFWLIIIFSLLLLPIILDEITGERYPKQRSFIERVFSFLSLSTSLFLLKISAVSVFICYISDYFLLRKITVLLTKELLGIWEISVTSHISEGIVSLGGFVITRSCLSLIFLALLIGFLFATSINLKKKVFLSFLGGCIIFMWNVARLSILIVLSNHGVSYLIAHDLFFYGGGTIIFILVLEVCSFFSTEIKKEFSSVSKHIKEKIILRYSTVV